MMLITKFVVCGCLAFAGAVMVSSAGAQGAQTQAATIEIKGTCKFGNKTSTWSAKLTPKGDGIYDAAYTSTWGGKPLAYTGQVKSDLKTTIAGAGKASGGGANGSFEFAGKFANGGVANCTYKEVGGGRGRSGTMTVDPVK